MLYDHDHSTLNIQIAALLPREASLRFVFVLLIENFHVIIGRPVCDTEIGFKGFEKGIGLPAL